MKELHLEANTPVYIAPYSPMTLGLKKYIIEHLQLSFEGFIDSYKTGDEIYRPTSISLPINAVIIIFSPNHSLSIYKSLLQIIASKKLFIVQFNQGRYYSLSPITLILLQKTTSIAISISSFLIKTFKKIMHNKKNILLLAPDFIDNNIKDFYLYLDQKSNYNACIATNNLDHYTLFKESHLNVVLLPSFKYIWEILRSHTTVIDHTPTNPWVKLSFLLSKTIQLWHGIPLKHLSPSINGDGIIYDIVVSTSDYVTENAFEKVFHTKHFIASGYPRNDLFLRTDTFNHQNILVDHSILDYVQKSTNKLIVYMPTYRENGFEQNPLNFDELNLFGKQNNLLFIIKLHPFISLGQFQSLSLEKYQYNSDHNENVILYPETNDIYPLLKCSHLLITDYSSVYFDYLLVNKPILFFVYDQQEYLSCRGDFMLDFDLNTPGQKCRNMVELYASILEELEYDKYSFQREKLKEKLYTFHDSNASSRICQRIEDL